MYLPLKVGEHVKNRVISMCKLLWYAQMHNSDGRENIKYIMNEVVTTYDVMLEIQQTYIQLIVYEQRMRPTL